MGEPNSSQYLTGTLKTRTAAIWVGQRVSAITVGAKSPEATLVTKATTHHGINNGGS